MTGKQGRILIVDDEEAIRRVLNQKLSREGYRCHEAGNSSQALDELRNNAIALVILDIKMPGKSGVELLPEIRTSYPDTAVSVDRALEKRRLELENRDYQQHLEQKVEAQARKIRASFLSAITALAYALEAKDKYTSGHSQRVAETSVAIAKELGLSQHSIERIRQAGLIHDIGKIGVRESVLNKPGRLTDEEFHHIKSHCEIGEHILTPIVEDEEILKVVRHHHERYDGRGYPDGLKSEQIPLGARILAVADTYDAMTSERPYREAMSDETACDEIKRCKGTQFDPVVADAFLRVRRFVSAVG